MVTGGQFALCPALNDLPATCLWLAEHQSFVPFSIYGVSWQWFIKAKSYLITDLPKGLNCANQKCWPWKKNKSPVNFRDCPCKTLLQTFKFETTGSQGLIMIANVFS